MKTVVISICVTDKTKAQGNRVHVHFYFNHETTYCISKGTSELTLYLWLQLLLPHHAHMEFVTVSPVPKIRLKGADLCVSGRAFSSFGNCPFHWGRKGYHRISSFSRAFGINFAMMPCLDSFPKRNKIPSDSAYFPEFILTTRSSLKSKEGFFFIKWKSSSLHYKLKILKEALVSGEQFTA